MTMDEEDGYAGSARLRIDDGREFEVLVELRGYFEPLDGRYHWRGRLASNDQLMTALGGRTTAATLTTGHGSAECGVSDPDPWGRYRVSGVSTPPFRTALTAGSPGASAGWAGTSSTSSAASPLRQACARTRRRAGRRPVSG
jgi:hypothetical protein